MSSNGHLEEDFVLMDCFAEEYYRANIEYCHHRMAGLDFAQNYSMTTGAKYSLNMSPVFISVDQRPDGLRRVWRRTGETYASICTEERRKFGGGSVTSVASTELVFVENGSLIYNSSHTNKVGPGRSNYAFCGRYGDQGIFIFITWTRV